MKASVYFLLLLWFTFLCGLSGLIYPAGLWIPIQIICFSLLIFFDRVEDLSK
jgi:uncharacterized RDD family membrane protein YckC